MSTKSDGFIGYALRNDALLLSSTETWKLKSRRKSPYFFDSGQFSKGSTLATLAQSYALALVDSGIDFYVLFGPPYKGIPLASATATALYEHKGIDVGFVFNRKEAKDHGEGGDLVGKSFAGRHVVIIDDVITTSGTMLEAHEYIVAHGGIPVAIIVAFDRQERSQRSRLSATDEVQRKLGILVISIATVSDLIKYLQGTQQYPEALAAIEVYQSRYGVM